ncbi:MAG TPA: hypothetical protein VNA26_07900 [Chitinophagaceae bacterium]|nr:hypothetical protein [Chitinophagaceae bacterium]
MYRQAWVKYLPVIKILLKRSAVSGDQVLNMNIPDFEKLGARKAGYKFAIEFSKGRVEKLINASPIAKDLSALLFEDAAVKELFTQNEYHISMNSKFQLAIKYIPQPVSETEEPVTEELAEETVA